MPYVIIAVLVVALTALGLVMERDDADPAAPAAPVSAIVARVERLRGLEFRTRPDPVRVRPAQARREALASLDADYPPARRRADAEALTLLGLVPPGTDLGEIVGETYGEGVAGYYDPRSGRLRVVEGAQTANRVLYEITVAHELEHALTDQAIGFDLALAAAGDDAGLAYTALVEGSATALMFRYADDRFSAEEALGGVLASAFQDTGDLPPFLAAQLVFPYVEGELFVRRLLAAGGGRWDVVDAALRFRPPASTEQVMHPQKYLRVEQPVAVRPPAARARLGRGPPRPHGGVDDRPPRGRPRRGGGLGRRRLRAPAPRRPARAGRPLGLGHARGRARVRGGAAGVGARARAGRARERRGRVGDARGHGRAGRRRSSPGRAPGARCCVAFRGDLTGRNATGPSRWVDMHHAHGPAAPGARWSAGRGGERGRSHGVGSRRSARHRRAPGARGGRRAGALDADRWLGVVVR